MSSAVTKEVKEEILAKVKAGEPAASVAEKYGVSVKSIYGWLRWNTTKAVSWLEYAKLKRENDQLKQIIGVLSLEVEKSKKRQVGKDLKAKLPNVSRPLISRALGIGQRNLYYQNTKRNTTDLILKDQILKVLELNPSYGHRRIALALGIGKKRARRVMRLYGIKPYKRKARWTKKKDYGRPDSGIPNLTKGSCPIRPNIVFAGVFIRLTWNERIIYLATFIDLFTREIVGWSVSTRHTTSAKASPWENAYQESFYDNFKTDLGLEFERFEEIGGFVEAIHQTINYYNQERIHTKLKNIAS